jgi:drug/metabolite transporter (DMT)-like permease
MSRRTWAELFVLAALWGAVYLLIAVALRGLPPVLVVLGRVTLGALVLTPWALRRGVLQPLVRHPWVVIQVVLVQATVPLLLLTFGQQHIPSGLAGVIVGAQPLFVALLAARFARNERPQGWRGVLGIALGLLGLVLLFGLDLRSGKGALLGGALVLTAALCYAAGALMIHLRLSDADPLGVAAAAMLVSTIALVVPGLLMLPRRVPSPGALGALITLGVVCTGMTLALFYKLIAQAGPSRAALAFYLSPAFAVVFGWIFLHEHITVITVLGLGAIVTGSALAAHRAEAGDRSQIRSQRSGAMARSLSPRAGPRGPGIRGNCAPPS